MRESAAIRYRLSVVSPLERRLREWGLAYGVRPARDPEDEVEPDHESPIARIVVDRTRERDLQDDAGWRPAPRVNITRARIRQMIGDGCRVPAWAGGDPMRAPKGGNGGGAATMPVPAEVEAVEDAVLALFRWDARAALGLRASYCLLGRRPLSERIAWLASTSGTKVTRMGYRAAVARGRIHVGAVLKLDG